MDPISLATFGMQAVGTGLSIFGGLKATGIAKEQAEASGRIAGFEKDIEKQRFQAMKLTAHRQQMEVVRNAQRARSLALNNATNQGAQSGSGLQGGYGQIAGSAGTNLLGINQNLEIGTNIFGLNQQISDQKMLLARLGGDMASAQGMASLGGSLMKAGPAFGKLFGGSFSESGGGGEGA